MRVQSAYHNQSCQNSVFTMTRNKLTTICKMGPEVFQQIFLRVSS
uniref:Uncharacterized protein n=1 Tax=Arundo donax TaxID=35708 RepID=A0A0A9DHR3_ARUDO